MCAGCGSFLCRTGRKSPPFLMALLVFLLLCLKHSFIKHFFHQRKFFIQMIKMNLRCYVGFELKKKWKQESLLWLSRNESEQEP